MVLASPVAIQNDFDQRYALNPNIVKNLYWLYAVDYDALHRDLIPVGRGTPTSERCGWWLSYSACKNVEGHKGVMLKVSRNDEGVDCTDKIVVKHNRMWCHNPLCPICFDSGFATVRARAIENRILAGVKAGMGKPEHITVSVPLCDYALPESVVRKRAMSAAKDRGVIGFGLIPHMYRIDRAGKRLYFSAHYHLIGFIEGGFDKCRNCAHTRETCASCSGVKGREVRGYARDGYLVKVHEIRKTVFGTAKYALNHSSVRVGLHARGYKMVSWVGTLSNRKFRTGIVEKGSPCPACGKPMGRVAHAGSRYIVKDRKSAEYVPYFPDFEFGEDGLPNYPEMGGDRGG
jgi:hypothetical protein